MTVHAWLGNFLRSKEITIANITHGNTVSLTTLDVGRMLGRPKQNMRYISHAHLLL